MFPQIVLPQRMTQCKQVTVLQYFLGMPPRTVRAPAGKNTSHQRTKAAKSLKEVYEDQCRDRHVHSNSSILLSLPDRQGAAINGEVLDVSRNFLGDKGLVPLLAVVERSTTLKNLILTENGLRNNAIKSLCQAIVNHPNIVSVDVSHNYISDGAGTAILALLKENRKIVHFDIQNTKIDPELRVSIKDALEQNMIFASVGADSK